jgi:hypothetical protein
MLNAYGRVDKGRLYPLNRGEDRNSAFGTHIGATYEHFKSMQRTQDSPDSIHGNSALHVEDIDSTHDARKKDNKGDTDESVQISDTLLSSLLINSVLSALRTGVCKTSLTHYLNLFLDHYILLLSPVVFLADMIKMTAHYKRKKNKITY